MTMLMKHLEESFNMTVQHYKQQQTVLFFFRAVIHGHF